jgi:histone-lysine N-methyltransferase SETD3
MRARRTLATTLARVSRRGLHGGPFGAAGAAGAVDEPPTEFFESIRALGGEHERFAEWLHARVSADETARGGRRNVHPAVTAARVPGMGVGLVARRPVRAGEIVLRIPRDAYAPFSATHALAAAKAKAPAFVDHAAKVAASMGAPELATHAALALHVLFELGDPRSEGFAYLATLPGLAGKASPSVPLLWTPTQVATLRGTPTHGRVLRRAKFVGDAHAALFGSGGGGGVPLEKFAWALSSVLSRASSGDRMPYAFLPGVDLLNHGGVDANCELSAVKLAPGGNEENVTWGDVEVTCVKDTPAGEQLTISYGDESDNCRLLRLYGFATRGNVHDKRTIELRLTGDALDAWRAPRRWGPGIDAARRAILRLHGLPRLTAEFEHVDAGAGLDDREVGGSNPGGAAVFRDPTLPRPETIDDEEEEEDEEPSRRRASGKEGEGTDVVRWRCVVAHPSKPFPTVARAADSSTPAAHAASDAATVLAATYGVPPSVLLASLRVHLLTGFEPAGPDGAEPDPRQPISERNEAAARAVLGEASERALRGMNAALRPGAGVDDAAGFELDELDAERAGAIQKELKSGEDWCASVMNLRRGQEEILEELLRHSR